MWITVRPPSRRVDHLVASLGGLQLGLVDDLLPDPAVKLGDQGGGGAFLDDAAVADDRHGRAQVRHVLDDVGRQDHHHVLADLGQQVEEAVALLRVQARGGLIDDDQARIADQGLGDAEPLAHAAREAGDGLLAHGPQIDLVEQALDDVLALLGAGDPLEHRHVVEHVVGRDARIDAEVLRQVAQGASQQIGRLQHVDIAKADMARGRGLQGGHRPHQGRFSSPVGTQKPVHAARDRQIDLVQGLYAIGVDVGEVLDDQHRRSQAPFDVKRGGISPQLLSRS